MNTNYTYRFQRDVEIPGNSYTNSETVSALYALKYLSRWIENRPMCSVEEIIGEIAATAKSLPKKEEKDNTVTEPLCDDRNDIHVKTAPEETKIDYSKEWEDNSILLSTERDCIELHGYRVMLEKDFIRARQMSYPSDTNCKGLEKFLEFIESEEWKFAIDPIAAIKDKAKALITNL